MTTSPEYEEKMRRAASTERRERPVVDWAASGGFSGPRFRTELGRWFLVVAAVGLGILIGWLIWG